MRPDKNPLSRVSRKVRRVAQRAAEAIDDRIERRARTTLRAQVSDVRKVHVGCGPHNLLEGWCNVDLRPFAGVDVTLDVTKDWPFTELDYVYSEHFLEHIALLEGVRFLHNAARSLRGGGTLRLSTPNLAWVMATHFALKEVDPGTRRKDTYRTNRAFHGWGHQFLYTEALLQEILREVGYTEIRRCGYGESDDPALRGLERHGGYSEHDGEPSVVILEAERGPFVPSWPLDLERTLREEYVRYVEAGH